VRTSPRVRAGIAAVAAVFLVGACGVATRAVDTGAGGASGGDRASQASRAGQGQSGAPTAPERSAAAQARATGRRVEVLSKRSETQEVFAEPNGTFTAQLHAGPVRVRRGGGWANSWNGSTACRCGRPEDRGDDRSGPVNMAGIGPSVWPIHPLW
jgi:hypothetical protein